MAHLCLVCLDSVLLQRSVQRHIPVLAIREYAPSPPPPHQVTIACKPSSTIAMFKNTEFRTSDNYKSTLI